MPSLTPVHRLEEASDAAVHNGLIAGALALIPSSASVYYAMTHYPKFVKSTNWQSRTALVIMPGLFAFALSSESKLSQKMHEMAGDVEHGRGVAEWHERRSAEAARAPDREAAAGGATVGAATEAAAVAAARVKTMSSEEAERQLTVLYRTSVENSGVRIVPGSSLGFHHRLSNFFMENPFKILAAAGVPTVLYIFKGRNEKAHLRLQSKIMHTRVYGQFAVITMLLSLMGFKSYMDEQGKFITEAEAQNRVEEMMWMRKQLLERLAADRERLAQRDRVLARAHNKDLEKLGHQQEDLQKYGVIELDEDIGAEEAEEIVADAGEKAGAAVKAIKGKKRAVGEGAASTENSPDEQVMATSH